MVVTAKYLSSKKERSRGRKREKKEGVLYRIE